MSDTPIGLRAGYSHLTEPDALQRDLGELARKHGLTGCVLVQLLAAQERIGVRSWGVNEGILLGMDWLATRILTDIDDGRHDPPPHLWPPKELI